LQIFSPEVTLIRDQVWINVDAYDHILIMLANNYSVPYTNLFFRWLKIFPLNQKLWTQKFKVSS